MERRPSALPGDVTVVVGQVAALLADRAALGENALPDALTMLVDGLGLRSAVIRAGAPGAAPGRVLAVAGEVVHVVPAVRGAPTGSAGPASSASGPLVELPIQHSNRPVAVLIAHGARPSQLPALRAAAAVIGLAMSAQPLADAAAAVELALVGDAEADRDALADALHDGPVQSLVVARYAADAAIRAGDPTGSVTLVRDAVQAVLVDLRRALWQLRPRAADDLLGALAELSARQVETGAPALDIQVDPQSVAALKGASAITAYRLVQSVVDGTTAVQVRGVGAVLEITGGRPLDEPERWQRRARAVGAALEPGPGRLRFLLPIPSRSTRPKATP